MTKTEKINIGDMLKYEAPNMYSREEATVAIGQNLKLGTVVGRVAATDQIKQLNPAAEDGTEIAIGILLQDADASEGVANAVIAVREVLISKKHIVWPSTITAAQKTAATQDLYNRGIVIRRDA
jgi:hypothetical protein